MNIDKMTDEEKQQRIAEALGFTVRFNETKGLHELITPDGKWEHPYDADGSESHCWKYAPEFPPDLNPAIALCEQFGDRYDVVIRRHNNSEWQVDFTEPSHEVTASDVSLSRAICEALLSILP